MQLLKTRVHRNWQEITQTQTLEYASLWRTIQVTTIMSVLIALLVGLAKVPRPWQDFLRVTASCSAFCTLALWYVYRGHSRANRLTLVAFLIFAALAAIVSLTRPWPAQGGSMGISSSWPVGFSVLTLAIGSILLVVSYRAFSTRMQWLGATPNAYLLNLVIGALAGGTLGLHLLLSAKVLAGGDPLRIPPWQVLVWTFCSYAGLLAVGEELLFRGLSLSVLCKGLHHSFWKAAWRVTFLNLLVCLAWIPFDEYSGIWFWIVAYRTVLSVVSAFIRQRQESVIPGLTANILFSLLAVVVIT